MDILSIRSVILPVCLASSRYLRNLANDLVQVMNVLSVYSRYLLNSVAD